MGALSYVPSHNYKSIINMEHNYDKLSLECQRILNGKNCESLDFLFAQGGSLGGTRPKANITIDGEYYLLKFFTHLDGKTAGKIEYDYSLCAKKCEINIPEIKLLQPDICDGYFAIKRFDFKGSIKST